MASPTGLATSEYLNSDDRVLKKQQLKCLIEELGKVETKQIVDCVVEEISKGRHLKYFPERQLFRNNCCKNATLKQFVSELHQLYIWLVNDAIGRNKYASLQMRWMNVVRILLHGPNTETISSGSVNIHIKIFILHIRALHSLLRFVRFLDVWLAGDKYLNGRQEDESTHFSL